jgi:hypothetical protein
MLSRWSTFIPFFLIVMFSFRNLIKGFNNVPSTVHDTPNLQHSRHTAVTGDKYLLNNVSSTVHDTPNLQLSSSEHHTVATGDKYLLNNVSSTVHDTPNLQLSSSEHHTVVTGDKYLLYYSHSGFANQLKAMQRAAQLAFATNRTLVLPSVLPHHTFQDKLRFPEFPYLTAGVNCEPYERYDEFIERIGLDVKKASSPENSFPSFTELFTFDDIFIKTGLQVIDMKDFAKVVENTNVTSWCSGRGNNTMRNMMVPMCERSDGLAFAELIPKFEDTCGNGKKIAAIGSGYVIPEPMWNNSRQQAIFDYFNNKLTPSKKFMQLLKEIHSRLPDNYYGVAIRFRDCLKVDDCDSKDVKEPFERILQYLSTKKKNNDNNSTEPGNSTHHILVGDGNEAALKCLRHHSQGEYTVSTVRDIVNRDRVLKRMIEGIKSEKSTIYLLLDQILIALAKEVAFGKVGTTAGTFHARIKLWRKQKNRILGKMQITN